MAKLKIILLAAASMLAAPLCAQAQDASDRILTDPTYLPLKGEVYGRTSYTYDRTRWNVLDANGDRTSHNRVLDNAVHQDLAYGLTDALSLNLTGDYVFGSRSRSSLANGGGVGSDRSGFTDPTFGVKYRLIDQRNHPFSLDLFGDYSPDLIDAKTADASDDATAARGGQAFDLGMSVGHQTRAFTIQGTVAGRYVGRREIENRLTGDSVRASGYWVPSLGVKTQTRLGDRLSFNAGADYNFAGDTHVVNEVNGLDHNSRQGDFQNVNLALNYHFIPNTLVGSLAYRHTFYSRTDNRFPIDHTLDFAIDDKSSDSLGAGLTYQFR